MFTFFQPKPGRYGVVPNLISGRCTGTVGDSGDTTFNFGAHPAKVFVNRVRVSAQTKPASSSAVSGVLYKYNATSNAAVALTGSVDLKGLTDLEGSAVALLSSLTDAQKTLNPGDTLEFTVTAAGTVSTQPVDLVVAVEVLVLE